MDAWIILAVLVVAYVFVGLILACLLWQSAHWKLKDWIAAVFYSPIVYVELWFEDVRRPKTPNSPRS